MLLKKRERKGKDFPAIFIEAKGKKHKSTPYVKWNYLVEVSGMIDQPSLCSQV
jgi:hypothetical protein